MTAAEKAKELFDKLHYQICNDCGVSESASTEFAAKQCVGICVDEIINSQPTFPTEGYYENYHDRADDAKVWWLNVRNEIEKIDLYPTI